MTTPLITKMKVVGKMILDAFKRSYADAQKQVNAWLAEAEAADWSCHSDIKQKYSSASFLPGNNVVFNLKGNKYRLLTKVEYQNKIILIKNAGTHDEYSRWRIQ